MPIQSQPSLKKIPLAKARGVITINATATKPVDKNESDNFRDYVFDLTNRDVDSQLPLTHVNVDLINTPRDKWRENTVAMKIQVPAKFSVEDYLNNLTDETNINFHRQDAAADISTAVYYKIFAHSVKATIELAEGEQSLTVRDGGDVLATVPTEGGPGVYTLVFDNDCKERREGVNDMDMLYRYTVIDHTPSSELRFRLGERFIPTPIRDRSIPPSLVDGKPCLPVKVSNPDDFPTDIT